MKYNIPKPLPGGLGGRNVRRARAGAIFLDVMAGVFALALGAAAFFSLYPTVHRSYRIGRDEAVSSQLAQRYVEHLQLLKPTDLNTDTLMQLNLVDPDYTPYVTGGYTVYSFSRLPMDEASSYSPGRQLRNGWGFLLVDSLPANSKRATIVMFYQSPSGLLKVTTTGTILGGYR